MKESLSRRVFVAANVIILSIYALTCLLPILNFAAISLSSAAKADAGKVGLWPVDFTMAAYHYIFSNFEFLHAFFNTVIRVIVGVPLELILTVMIAYPLSRPAGVLKYRTFISWFFVFTMLFSGGLIPNYMLVNALHLNNSIWALVLPRAVPVFNVVLMINFFKQVPEDFYEAAVLDGASELTIMCRIFIPLSIPSIVTILLFMFVGHWNAWFDGIIYMNDISKYPLQSYLQSVVISKADLASTVNPNALINMSQTTINAARLFLSVTPIILIYLPLQKYFIKGLTLGGVKG